MEHIECATGKRNKRSQKSKRSRVGERGSNDLHTQMHSHKICLCARLLHIVYLFSVFHSVIVYFVVVNLSPLLLLLLSIDLSNGSVICCSGGNHFVSYKYIDFSWQTNNNNKIQPFCWCFVCTGSSLLLLPLLSLLFFPLTPKKICVVRFVSVLLMLHRTHQF